jgi:hypothetical protein
MQLEYALLSEGAERLVDGRFSLFGCDFDVIEVPEVPTQLFCRLLMKFSLEEGESLDGHVVKLEIENPQGERKFGGESELVIEANEKRPKGLKLNANLNVRLGIQFLSFGIQKFHIFVDGTEVKEIRLAIIQMEQKEAK